MPEVYSMLMGFWIGVITCSVFLEDIHMKFWDADHLDRVAKRWSDAAKKKRMR